jgi:two-component system nitrate/nitrite response regulator NarL
LRGNRTRANLRSRASPAATFLVSDHPPSTIRVLLADARPLVRLGVHSALRDSGVEICAECADAGAAITTAIRERPDVCLIDLGLPGGGIEAAETITDCVPHARVVVVAESQDVDVFLHSVHAGATGYLMADMNPSRLAHALRDVVEGKAVVPRSLVMPVVAEVAASGRESPAGPLS